MTFSLRDSLPEALREVRTKPLFGMHLDVRPLQIIGATPSAYRRIGEVPSGVFEGERLSGLVLDGGSDWQNVRSDGSITLDVRLVLKTADDALISMTYRGIRQGASDLMAVSRKQSLSTRASTISGSHRSSKPRRPNMLG